MINYDLFRFACPPCVGGEWFVEAAGLAGFAGHAEGEGWVPFTAGPTPTVTLIRHPCDWLGACWRQGGYGAAFLKSLGSGLGELPMWDFQGFIAAYLKSEHSVGGAYFRYMADVVLRLEDMPDGLVELLDTLGVPEPMRRRCRGATLPSLHPFHWPRQIREQIVAKEREVCDAYGYT